MMGRPLDQKTLCRMRELLFDHDLPAPLVARRMGLSERVVQVYRRQWSVSLDDLRSSVLEESVFILPSPGCQRTEGP